jgi:hypothetical protein
MAGHPAVNRDSAGSSPAAGALGPSFEEGRRLQNGQAGCDSPSDLQQGSESRSSIGQDAALSKPRGGFNSRTGRKPSGCKSLVDDLAWNEEAVGSIPTTLTAYCQGTFPSPLAWRSHAIQHRRLCFSRAFWSFVSCPFTAFRPMAGRLLD